MKPKMHYQIQPREIAPPPSVPVVREQIEKEQIQEERAREEIQRFLQALDSYPARVAEQPSLSFQQHLSRLFAARSDSDRSRNERRDNRARRQ
jgi:hypothetical protein